MRNMKSLSTCLLLLCLLAGIPGLLMGQFETASVLGTVRDATGLPVAGSKVTLLNVLTGVAQTATTTDSGD